MFSTELSVYILPNGMGKSRVDIFRNALLKLNVKIIEEIKGKIVFDGQELLILVDETSINDWDKFEKAISKKQIDKTIKYSVVKSTWLSECLKLKKQIVMNDYLIIKPVTENNKVTLKRNLSRKSEDEEIKRSKQEEFESDSSESEGDNEESNETAKKLLNSQAWICAHSSNELKINLNKHITDKLEELLKIYENTKDKYRALGYQKAIAALKRYPKKITTWEVSC
jgi:DNA polymerase lambda